MVNPEVRRRAEQEFVSSAAPAFAGEKKEM